VEDAILVSSVTPIRELFWQLTCLTEAIDEGRACIVLCPDSARAQAAATAISSTLHKAGLEYATSPVLIDEQNQLPAIVDSVPLITVFTPWTLSAILNEPELLSAREFLVSTLGRVALPAVDEWPDTLASNTAYLLRKLNLECAIRGITPSLVGTSAPRLHLKDYLTKLWGKPVDGSAIVVKESVERPQNLVVNYSGGLVRNPSDHRQWIRQEPGAVASDLLAWLVGTHPRRFDGQVHVEYVLDVSGSMHERLTPVKAAVRKDLIAKLEAGSLKEGHSLGLTVFESEPTRVFSEEIATDTLDRFTYAMDGEACRGGTDLAPALIMTLEKGLQRDVGSLVVILFSDGESGIDGNQRTHLLRLSRQARQEGRNFRLLYVTLDMDPPQAIKNLIIAMGGRIIRQSTADLGTSGPIDGDSSDASTVVFLSGEHGLSSDIIQDHQGGYRHLVYTRSISNLDVNTQDIHAVVVSGNFGSIAEIRDQVGHLGRELLPVFVLTQAEAGSQILTEDYQEAANLRRIPVLFPENPQLRERRLDDSLRSGRIKFEEFRYLHEGAPSYEAMVKSLKPASVHEEAGKSVPSSGVIELDPSFELETRGRNRYVRRVDREPGRLPHPLDTVTNQRIKLEGEGILKWRDLATAALVCHEGALEDGVGNCAEVGHRDGEQIVLRSRRLDRHEPILDGIVVKPLKEDTWSKTHKTLGQLGDFWCGEVHLGTQVSGVRVFPRSNLEGQYTDSQFGTPQPVQIVTRAFLWKPLEANEKLFAGLVNILRLAIPTLLRLPTEKLLISPENDVGIWLVELTEGGNCSSEILYREPEILRQLLSLGGRIALECPCELGFSGDSSALPTQTSDSGCPRCMRVIGPVIQDAGVDLLGTIEKRSTLEWLLNNGLLPGTAQLQLLEKYDSGVHDAQRIIGPNAGSRRGILRHVRRILSDRLGLELEDEDVASFVWLTGNSTATGMYSSGSNVLSLLKGLREWFAYDVCAHEFFHNLQYKSPGLFEHASLGDGATPKPLHDGKIFIEGSAEWGASQVVDALALRTALDMTNLRHGDEYGDGFQIMKHIEENYGGIQAVLMFLATGDIALATGGKINSVRQLYSAIGLS